MEDSWEKNSWTISVLWMWRWGNGGAKKGGGVKSESPNSHPLGSLHSPADTVLAACIHELPCSPFKSLGNLPVFLLNLVFWWQAVQMFKRIQCIWNPACYPMVLIGTIPSHPLGSTVQVDFKEGFCLNHCGAEWRITGQSLSYQSLTYTHGVH